MQFHIQCQQKITPIQNELDLLSYALIHANTQFTSPFDFIQATLNEICEINQCNFRINVTPIPTCENCEI